MFVCGIKGQPNRQTTTSKEQQQAMAEDWTTSDDEYEEYEDAYFPESEEESDYPRDELFEKEFRFEETRHRKPEKYEVAPSELQIRVARAKNAFILAKIYGPIMSTVLFSPELKSKLIDESINEAIRRESLPSRFELDRAIAFLKTERQMSVNRAMWFLPIEYRRLISNYEPSALTIALNLRRVNEYYNQHRQAIGEDVQIAGIAIN